MTVEKAQALIRQYGVVLQKSVHPAVFQSKKALPCSIARMKFAIYRFIIELHRREQLNQENIENMIAAYSYLCFFVDEEVAQTMNAVMLQKDDNSRHSARFKNQYRELVHELATEKEKLTREIKEFIFECREYVKN